MFSKHQIEQEIKLTAPDEATLNQLINSSIVKQAIRDPGICSAPRRFAATYYDTSDWALRDLRWSLRTRYEGEIHMSTLKRNSIIKHGYSSCDEIEQATEKGFESLACVPKGKIADALHAVLPKSAALLERVNVTMARRKQVLEIGRSRLELVTDSGFISANGQQTELHEVELELLQGDIHDHEVSTFTRQLINRFMLQPSHFSKHQIGLSYY